MQKELSALVALVCTDILTNAIGKTIPTSRGKCRWVDYPAYALFMVVASAEIEKACHAANLACTPEDRHYALIAWSIDHGPLKGEI